MRLRTKGADPAAVTLAAVTLVAVTLAGCGSPGPATVRARSATPRSRNTTTAARPSASEVEVTKAPGSRILDGEPATRGRIVGVLGGYQEGGSTAGVSYSAYLGRAIRQLYRQATA
jgi:predicted small lipoprotein YifL